MGLSFLIFLGSSESKRGVYIPFNNVWLFSIFWEKVP